MRRPHPSCAQRCSTSGDMARPELNIWLQFMPQLSSAHHILKQLILSHLYAIFLISFSSFYRQQVHVLPREILGCSTFGLSMLLLKWFPVQMVDRLLLLVARLMLGDTARFGLERPQIGPLELKSLSGKTPVLDVGTLAKIKSGDIKVCSAIKRFAGHGVEFVDGRSSEFDAVILATGYKSDVPTWLKEREFFSEKDGLPRRPFPDGWKGERGLYAVGFTKRGILGASMDAMRIAHDVEQCWRAEAKQLLAFHCPSEQK